MPAELKNSYQGMFSMDSIAEDLANLLSSATGKEYRSEPYFAGAKGIFLLLDTTYLHSSNEAGNVVYKNGDIIIRAKYSTGISYAVYSWLQELGFIFSLPGGEWTTVPKLKHLSLAQSSYTYYPYFRLRTFYASGGMPDVKGLDESGLNEREWWLWYRRNRMGSDYQKISGHIGELFNILHEKQITEDPGILAPVDGKRKYSIGGKLDPTYHKGVELFSNWIVNEYKKEQRYLPVFLPHKKYYTVDPGDGLDYCHTPECEKQFSSVSDQMFTVANITARKIKKVDPRAGVSTMAYTERADTPTIRIEPNIHVMVVPTAFQSVSTSTELMQRWRLKTPNISQYDFLNIGVWSLDQPFFDMSAYISRLAFLKSLQIEGMSFETSMSKFASGIQQFFILKYLCEPYSSPDSLLSMFCKQNFDAAAPHVEKLFREWYFSDVHINTNRDKESFLPDELGRFLNYIQKAEDTRRLSKAVKERIFQLKAYVVYLCSFYELFQSPEFKTAQKQKGDEVLRNTWSLYSKNILHNTQLNDMLKKYSTDPASWNYKTHDFSSYKKTDAEPINKLFESYLLKYRLIIDDPEIQTSVFDQLLQLNPDSISISSMDEEAFRKFIYPVSFYASTASKLKISYQLKTAGVKSKNRAAIIACESADFSFIQTNFMYPQDDKGTVHFNIPAKGKYRLILSYFDATPVKFIIYPEKQLFYLHKKSLLMNGMLLHPERKSPESGETFPAFLTNSDQVTLGYNYQTSITPLKLYDQAGNNIPANRSNPYITLKNSSGNKLIYYTNEVYRWPPVLLDTKPYFFFLKFK